MVKKSLPHAERFGGARRLRNREEQATRRYRYRTSALTGPWRESHEDAVGDAVKAKQARPDETQPGGIMWIVPGEIEVRSSEGAASEVRR